MNKLVFGPGNGILYYSTFDSKSEEFFAWINQYCNNPEEQIAKIIELGIDQAVVVNHIEVTEAFRSQGIGRSLINDLLMTHGTNPVILVADSFGSNNVNLEQWYLRLGFCTIAATCAGPLMVKL